MEVCCLSKKSAEAVEETVQLQPEETDSSSSLQEELEDSTPCSFEETPTEDQHQDKIVQLEQEKEAINQQYLRLRADLENIRRRSQMDLAGSRQAALEEIMTQILPILDNMERALNAPADNEGWRKGVEMVMRQFQEVLMQQGLEPIPAEGVIFDPQVHEAVLREPADVPEGTILQEMQKGYKFNGKVIRPSMVKVADA
jgi:molecular chaperone GrpE